MTAAEEWLGEDLGLSDPEEYEPHWEDCEPEFEPYLLEVDESEPQYVDDEDDDDEGDDNDIEPEPWVSQPEPNVTYITEPVFVPEPVVVPTESNTIRTLWKKYGVKVGSTGTYRCPRQCITVGSGSLFVDTESGSFYCGQCQYVGNCLTGVLGQHADELLRVPMCQHEKDDMGFQARTACPAAFPLLQGRLEKGLLRTVVVYCNRKSCVICWSHIARYHWAHYMLAMQGHPHLSFHTVTAGDWERIARRLRRCPAEERHFVKVPNGDRTYFVVTTARCFPGWCEPGRDDLADLLFMHLRWCGQVGNITSDRDWAYDRPGLADKGDQGLWIMNDQGSDGWTNLSYAGSYMAFADSITEDQAEVRSMTDRGEMMEWCIPTPGREQTLYLMSKGISDPRGPAQYRLKAHLRRS